MDAVDFKLQYKKWPFESHNHSLILYNLVLSADIFCKQFGTRSLMVFLIEFFEKVDFEKRKKYQLTAIKHEKFPRG